MTTEQKQPQAGEWWIAPSGIIVRIFGTKINGQILYESDIGGSCHSAKAEWWSEWHHEPRCTGFNWVAPEPETFPQYWTTMDSQDSYVAYVRRINAGQFVIVKRDGTDGITCRWSEFDAKHRTRLTPEEAAALIVRPDPPAIDPGEGWELLQKGDVIKANDDYFDKHNQRWCPTISAGLKVGEQFTMGAYRRRKPTAAVESPDDWVEITDPEHVLREGIDEVWYSFEEIVNEWQQVFPSAGMKLIDSQYKLARCRRRDFPAPPAPIEQERWFMWSDDRYPIAFVKRTGGKVFNLNVDGLFKTSDDWGQGYEEKLTNGELIEVTESSAKAYLRRPRRKIIDPQSPQPKRTPVRLWKSPDDNRQIVWACSEDMSNDSWQEIKFYGSGFYVEGE